MRSNMKPSACYILRCHDVIYIWHGARVRPAYARKARLVVAQLRFYEKAPATVVVVVQGQETGEYT